MKLHRSDLVKIIIEVGVFIGIAVNLGGFLELFGISGSPQLGSLIVIGAFLIVLANLIYKYIISLRSTIISLEQNMASVKSLKLVQYEAIKDYVSGNLWTVHILGSGTETYYALITRLLSEGVIKSGSNLHIGFRRGSDSVRKRKFSDYSLKWDQLAKSNNLRLSFYPYDDFFFNFRGVVFSKSIGFIGFYHRVEGKTVGYGEPLILALESDEIGAFLIENFIRVFDSLSQQESLLNPLPKTKQ